MSALLDGPAYIAACLADRDPADRARFLQGLLAHATAGLVVTEGEREAAEAVYRLADAVVARSVTSGPVYCPAPVVRLGWVDRLRQACRRLSRTGGRADF